MKYIVDTSTGKLVSPDGGSIPKGCTLVEAPAAVSRRIDAGMTYHSISSEWVGDPAQLLDENWRRVRIRRDALLVCTDFTQLPDVTLDHATWAVYRQALRDVTSQPDPTAITWPTPPDASIIKNVPPMEVL